MWYKFYLFISFLFLIISCNNSVSSIKKLVDTNTCDDFIGLWKYELDARFHVKKYIKITSTGNNLYEFNMITYEHNIVSMRSEPTKTSTYVFECKDGILETTNALGGKVIIQKNGESLRMNGNNYYRAESIDSYPGKEDPEIVRQRNEEEYAISRQEAEQKVKMYDIQGTPENPVYLYSSPSENDIKNQYIDDYRNVVVEKWSNGFGYIEISNNMKGWVKSKNLKK